MTILRHELRQGWKQLAIWTVASAIRNIVLVGIDELSEM